jgi:plastocyanin/heme-degrading monooxygenase HmoA
MEYIQTILFQVAASRLEEASQAGNLLPELDSHRDFLRQQPGFRDIRITRSINNEGNVLVVVETRWEDDSSLVRYETSEPNAAAIVRRHQALTVPDSLQVLDMEALRTEASWRAAEHETAARSRVILPIVIPLGILAFALLAIYGLSRIYLEIGGDGAVALATGIAIGILVVSFYLAANPKAPGWVITGILGIAALALVGGTIWAVASEDETTAEEQVSGGQESGGETGGEAGGETPGETGGETGGGEIAVSMLDNSFDPDAITVSAGTDVSFAITNDGSAVHNMRIAGADGEYSTDDDAVSDPDLVTGGGEATLDWSAPDAPGDVPFQCDFHPTEMVGTITVE